MAAVGADVEQLRKTAQTCRQKAEYLESTITQGLSRQITESPWKGTDADSFRNQWQSDLAPKEPSMTAPAPSEIPPTRKTGREVATYTIKT